MIDQHIDNVLIWDLEGSPPAGDFTNVLWHEFVTPESTKSISIPELIEKNAEALRSRYLAWIFELGELRIDDHRLIDHLEIRPGFSYWWMTLLVEKCNHYKALQITDAIRLFAFEEWAKNFPTIEAVKLVSANHELRECLESWCKTKKIRFESQDLPVDAGKMTILGKIFNRLPATFQASAWLLKYLIDRWPLRGVGFEEWRKAKSQVTFVSYFFNLQSRSARAGRYESAYWTKLPDILDEREICSSWLHLYVKNPLAPNAKSAAQLLRSFNANGNGKQVHVFLDSFLTIKTVIFAFRDYLRIRRLILKDFSKISQFKIKQNQSMESVLWPLFKKDWIRSFFGDEAIKNLLNLRLFEKAFSGLPTQSSGVYLQENQGWEFGMIHAWRFNSHGSLIGFPHATVRFWDLRYFFDQRTLCKKQVALPMPDLVAVSGDSVKDAYLEGGYPAECLVRVEALRYLYLEKIDEKEIVSKSFSGKPSKILILGDYLASNTLLQMKLLREIAADLSNIELMVKSHPICPIVVADYPELKLQLLDQPLSDLLRHFDIAYTSSVTSAAVDAYSAGLRVISVLGPTTLNLSPLRGVAGVEFVSSSEMLRDALLETPSRSVDAHERIHYFNVDSSLPRWQALLTDSIEYIRS